MSSFPAVVVGFVSLLAVLDSSSTQAFHHLSSRVNKKNTPLRMSLLDSITSFLGLEPRRFPEPCVMGDESIMSPKEHGTSRTPVQGDLRWSVDRNVADRICNYNRHYAEYRGYWLSTEFEADARREYAETGEVKFYDSNTGKLLFVAPRGPGRTLDEFLQESKKHGWPSFRDEEVVWENGVRCLPNGEAVSLDGTHLGHNLPDYLGSRYCINLVSVAGRPVNVSTMKRDDDKETSQSFGQNGTPATTPTSTATSTNQDALSLFFQRLNPFAILYVAIVCEIVFAVYKTVQKEG